MLDILFTLCQLLAVTALAYGVFLVAKFPNTFSQSLALAEQARSNPYGAIEHKEIKGEDLPNRGRTSRVDTRRAAGLARAAA